MKITIIGNCQAELLRQIIAVIRPGCTLQAVSIVEGVISGSAGARDSDMLFVQTEFLPMLADGAALSELGQIPCIGWPTFYFSGFHPDLVYIEGRQETIASAIGDYNSSIVFYAWQKALTPQGTKALFCEEVFEKLGFFEYWPIARRALEADIARTGLDLDGEIDRWIGRGCFAHSVNHPKLFVLSAIANALLKKIGLTPVTNRPEEFMYDTMIDPCVWPVYPEIGRRIGVSGDYIFKISRHLCPLDRPVQLLNLEQFIEGSFAAYDRQAADIIRCDRLDAFSYLYEGIETIARSGTIKARHPYSTLPANRFWQKSLADRPWAEIDPIEDSLYPIDQATCVATAGSCFAQHIAKLLDNGSCHFLVTERQDFDLGNNPQFSARFGNIYSFRQLRQLWERAHGQFEPMDEAWQRADGKLIDPFRPTEFPAGFETLEPLQRARREHFIAVRSMFEQCDRFIFTVGLTEAWRRKADGAVFPVVPQAVATRIDADAYEFVNFSVGEMLDDFRVFMRGLSEVKPTARVILTVSPVPLLATYEARHVLLSNSYSKAALRVVADRVTREFAAVEYFPALEIITGHNGAEPYFAADRRTVSAAGIGHVMRIFSQHFVARNAPDGNAATASPFDQRILSEIAAGAKIICDDNILEQGLPRPRSYAIEQDIELIMASRIFDALFYTTQVGIQFPDERSAIEHYVRNAHLNGVSPNSLFDVDFYCEKYSAEGNPIARGDVLIHFLTKGRDARLYPLECFDWQFYLAANPDVAASGLDPYLHYVLYGAHEGRAPSPNEVAPLSAAGQGA